MNSRWMIWCTLVALLFTSQKIKAITPNDSCSNAIVIKLNNRDLGIGTFLSDTIDIDSATIESGEYFANSLSSAGLDDKSIWYKFYVPVRRGVNVKLSQVGSSIGTYDCGFTTYYSESCLPGTSEASKSRISALNQFGNSYYPCLDPGWYMIQVSTKSSVNGKVFVEITTSYPYQNSSVSNAKYDVPSNAYYFGNTVIGAKGSQTKFVKTDYGCYTIDDSSEYCSDSKLGKDSLKYSQSGWYVFNAKNKADNSQIKISNLDCKYYDIDTFVYRLFKGDCRSSVSSLQQIEEKVVNWKDDACDASCDEIVFDYTCQFDSGVYYTIQLIFKEDVQDEILVRLSDQTGNYTKQNGQPMSSSSANLGVLNSNSNSNFSFTCDHVISNNACGTVNNSSISIGNYNYNLAQWYHFELKQTSNVAVAARSLTGGSTKELSLLALRIFADTITSNCSDISENNLIYSGSASASLTCLPPGNYAIQVLGSDTIPKLYECHGSATIGGDFRLQVNPSPMPDRSHFSLYTADGADSVNHLDPLPNYSQITASADTVACSNTILPGQSCDSSYKKAIYRVFTIGDSDNNGTVDSGMISYSYRSSNLNRFYKGNVFGLRSSQSIQSYPDTLAGLKSYTDCITSTTGTMDVCLEPGTYTHVAFFDQSDVGSVSEPRMTFYHHQTRFSDPASAEFLDSLSSIDYVAGAYDTFSCSENPTTIDGYYCGKRNTFHVFYVDSPCVVTLTGGHWYSLFSGDVRQGISGLKLFDDGQDWSGIYNSKTSEDCYPLTPGYYTVVVSNNTNIDYTSNRNNSNSSGLYTSRHRVIVTTRKSTANINNYNRPWRAANLDTLINGSKPLDYASDYGNNGMQLTLAKFNLPTVIIDCDPDSSIGHFPDSLKCNPLATDFVYYTFNLEHNAYVKLVSDFNFQVRDGGEWNVQLYPFDIKQNPNILYGSNPPPIQDCNYNPNFVEFCYLPAGSYTIVYMCKRTTGRATSIKPQLYIDRVFRSRFDHAKNAYDFGAIPGDNQYHDGAVNDVHPSDTTLPPSHDYFTCRTGAALSDPNKNSCSLNNTTNPLIYSGGDSAVIYPYDSAMISRPSGSKYDPWKSSRRNLWYSFVINGKGTAYLQLNGLTSSAAGIQSSVSNNFCFSVFKSDASGSQTLAQLYANGALDSTQTDGLEEVNLTDYGSSGLIKYFSLESCERAVPTRYYVLVDVDDYFKSSMVNSNVWMEIKYDSVDLDDTRYDYYSSANTINGFNDQNSLLNASFEDNDFWTTSNGNWELRSSSITGISGRVLYAYSSGLGSGPFSIYQTVDLGSAASVSGSASISGHFSGSIQTGNESTPDEGRYRLVFYNNTNQPIDSIISTWQSSTTWMSLDSSFIIPSGAVRMNVFLEAKNNGANSRANVYFDEWKFRLISSKPEISSELSHDFLYRGDSTVFAGSTHDLTDSYHGYYSTNNCFSEAASVWYKTTIHNSGYLHYNMKRSYLSNGTLKEEVVNSVDRIRVYESIVDGDSLSGLTYRDPGNQTSGKYRDEMGGNAKRICVNPGTYYIQLNKCKYGDCSDVVFPQIVFEKQSGDMCGDAADIILDTFETQSAELAIDCHSMGESFGEDGTDLACLSGPYGYKSTWFSVTYEDTAKADIEFTLTENTTASSDQIQLRAFYGDCNSLTPVTCNSDALTTFELECVRNGTYTIQVVTPESAIGEIKLQAQSVANTNSSCIPQDPNRVIANFDYQISCPENSIEFLNRSSRGDSIEYTWYFGRTQDSSQMVNPFYTFPELDSAAHYTVTLVAENIQHNTADTVVKTVLVPRGNRSVILTNDTLLCEGDSVLLTGRLNYGTGIWRNGSTDSQQYATRTGLYVYRVFNPGSYLRNGSFEVQPSSSNGWTINSGNWRNSNNAGYEPQDSQYVTYAQHSSNAASLLEMYQDLDLSSYSSQVDSLQMVISISGLIRGYEDYADGGSFVLEFLNSSGGKIDDYSSRNHQGDFWQFYETRQLVPSGTRKLRLKLISEKNNTTSRTSYVFFDGFKIELQSGCPTADSVNVHIFKNPDVSLPEESIFCKNDSIELKPTISYDVPYLVNDSTEVSTTGTLTGDAVESMFNYISLAEDDGDRGYIDWEDTSNLTSSDTIFASFDYYLSGNDNDYLWLYAFNTSRPVAYASRTNGTTLTIQQGFRDQITLYQNGYYRYRSYPGFSLPKGQWVNIRCEYINGKLYLYFDDKLVFDYSISVAANKGSMFGISAFSDGASYRIKNVMISNHNPQLLIEPDLSTLDHSFSWSDGDTSLNRFVSDSIMLSFSVTNEFGCKSNLDTTLVDTKYQYTDLISDDVVGVCDQLDTFQLDPPISNGKYVGNNAVLSDGSIVVGVSPYTKQEVYFEATDTFGCLFRDTAFYRLDTIPKLSIYSTNNLCFNSDTIHVSSNYTDGFFFGGNYIDSAGVFNPTQTDSLSNKVYFTNNDSICSATDSMNVIVYQPEGFQMPNYNDICLNAGTTTLSKPTANGHFYGTASYIDSAASFDPLTAGIGNHKIYYVNHDTNGCFNTDSTTITVLSLPDASIKSAGPFCENSGLQQLSGLNNTGVFTATSYLNKNGEFSPANAGAGSFKIFHSYTDTNGCTSLDSAIIDVDTIPVVTLTNPGAICQNGSSFTIQTGTNNSGTFSSKGYLTTGGVFSPSNASVGLNNVVYSFTDGKGCTAGDSILVRVDSIPNASITAAGPFCQNDGSNRLIPAVNSGGYFFSNVSIDSNGRFTTDSLNVGSNQFYYSFTDGNGCRNVDSILVQIDSIPDASIINPGSFCMEDDTVTLRGAVNTGTFVATSYLSVSGLFNPDTAGVGRHIIYHTRTDGNSCTNTDSLELVVNGLPDASIKAAGPFCANEGAKKLVGNVNTGGSFTSTNYLDSNGNFYPQKSGSGSFTVYYTFMDTTRCFNTDSTTITIDSIPDASIVPSGPFCQNANAVKILPKINSGGFFSKTKYIDSVGIFKPDSTQVGANKVFYHFTDGKGCSNTDSIKVIIDSIPDARILNQGPYCQNVGVQNIKGITNTDSFAPTSYISKQGLFDPMAVSIGSHKIIHIVTDTKGCVGKDSTAIVVDSIPDASITPAGPFCMNSGIQKINAKFHVGGTFYGSSFISTLGQFNPMSAGKGIHHILYSLTDSKGCTGVDSISVEVDTIPDARIVPFDAVCQNSADTLLKPLINPGGVFSPMGLVDTIGRISPSQISVGSHFVYYTIVDGKGCSGTDSIALVIDSIPNAGILATNPICENDTVQIIKTYNPGGLFRVTQFIDSVGAFNPGIAKAGIHKVYHSITDLNGCTGADSIDIFVDTIPDASILQTWPYCENSNMVKLSTIHSGGVFFPSNLVDASGNFYPNTVRSGIHKIFHQFTDGNGCMSLDSANVVVDTVPDAEILFTWPFCENSGLQNISGVTNSDKFSSPGAYIDSSGIFDPSISASGNHPIYHQVVDGNGCIGYDTAYVQIDSFPDASLLQVGLLCNDTVDIQLQPVHNNGGVFSPATFVSSSGLFSASSLNPGIYKVTYTFSDGNGCISSDSMDIEVLRIPTNKISLSADEGCEPLLVTFATTQEDQLTWIIDGKNYSDTALSIVFTSGLYPINLQTSTNRGCQQSIDTSLMVHPKPFSLFDYQPKTIYEIDGKVTFEDQSTSNIQQWIWDFDNGDTSHASNPVYTFENAGDYETQLIVFNEFGCSDTSIQNLIVLDNGMAPANKLLVMIPTAFSPNNDGNNDEFRIVSLGAARGSYKIFNRWGEKLFEGDISESWKPNVEELDAFMGTYLYLISVFDNDGKEHTYEGYVVLVQ